MDIDESSQVLIILGRTFLVAVRPVINMQASSMSFQFCVKRVAFCFPLHTTFLALDIHPCPAVSMHFMPPVAVPGIKMFDRNGGPHMSCITFPDLPSPIPASLRGIFIASGR